MENKKILITGGLGYIGAHTTVLFMQAGYDVVILDNLSNAHKESVLTAIKELTGKEPLLYEGDIRNYDYLDNLFSKEEHQVKKLIFSSSATVYDTEKNIPPFTETDRLSTTNPYGTTKLVIEKLLYDMALHKGFSAICLRYFNPIGAHSSGLL